MHLFTSVYTKVYAVASIIWFQVQDLSTLCNRRNRTPSLNIQSQIYSLPHKPIFYERVSVHVCMYISHNSVAFSMANSKYHGDAALKIYELIFY